MKTRAWLALASAATLAAQVTLLYLPDPTGVGGSSRQTRQGEEPQATQPHADSTANATPEPANAAESNGEETETGGPSSAQKLTQVAGDAVKEAKSVARVVVNRAPRNTDKVVHASIFAAATATAVATLPRGWWWSAPALQSAHALGGEHLQRHIPGRGYDRADIYANLVGVGAGTLAGYGLRRRLRARP